MTPSCGSPCCSSALKLLVLLFVSTVDADDLSEECTLTNASSGDAYLQRATQLARAANDQGTILGPRSSTPVSSKSPALNFSEYIRAFNRRYDQGSDEYVWRSALFQRRAKEMRVQNSQPSRYWTAGINEYTDWTEEELRKLRGWRRSGSNADPAGPALLTIRTQRAISLPREIIWKNTTSASSVADQGACGSCWAIATAAMLQARYEIHMGDASRTFSAQELVNCVPNPRECGGSGGCDGATVELAMEYVQKKGLASSSEVPYRASDGKCQSSAVLASVGGSGGLQNSVSGLRSWQTLPSNKARPLMEALQDGPVAVSVAAMEWYSYFNGVFDSCSKDSIIDHAVVMVGYGSEYQRNYWTIQNSWGVGWGELGFIRIKRHETTDEDDAHCGTDRAPGDGVACKPYPAEVTVCGMCGLLYDSVAPEFSMSA